MAFYYLASYYFIIVDMYVRFTIWVILGVMATIGLGTGVYTGTFYLFPYILAIKDTAERCGHLDFSLLTMECGETIANEVPLNPRNPYQNIAPTVFMVFRHKPRWIAALLSGEAFKKTGNYWEQSVHGVVPQILGRHDNRAGGVAELHVWYVWIDRGLSRSSFWNTYRHHSWGRVW